MMKCDRYQGLLMRYFDHELEGHEREALDRHLLACPHCRALREDLTGILNPLENAAPIDPGTGLERLVLSRVASLHVHPKGDQNRLLRGVYGTLAGLAALLLIAFGLSVQSMGFLDLLLAGQDYVYWSSTILYSLQIAYGIASGLFPADMLEALFEIQAVSLMAVVMLILVALKAAIAGPTGRNPDTF